jgi:hypothetical protein
VLVSLCAALYVLVSLCVALYVLVSLCAVLYVLVSLCVALYVLVSLCEQARGLMVWFVTVTISSYLTNYMEHSPS